MEKAQKDKEHVPSSVSDAPEYQTDKPAKGRAEFFDLTDGDSVKSLGPIAVEKLTLRATAAFNWLGGQTEQSTVVGSGESTTGVGSQDWLENLTQEDYDRLQEKFEAECEKDSAANAEVEEPVVADTPDTGSFVKVNYTPFSDSGKPSGSGGSGIDLVIPSKRPNDDGSKDPGRNTRRRSPSFKSTNENKQDGEGSGDDIKRRARPPTPTGRFSKTPLRIPRNSSRSRNVIAHWLPLGYGS